MFCSLFTSLCSLKMLIVKKFFSVIIEEIIVLYILVMFNRKYMKLIVLFRNSWWYQTVWKIQIIPEYKENVSFKTQTKLVFLSCDTRCWKGKRKFVTYLSLCGANPCVVSKILIEFQRCDIMNSNISHRNTFYFFTSTKVKIENSWILKIYHRNNILFNRLRIHYLI